MNTTTAHYFSGKMRHELKTDKHTIYTDVSVEAGGEDSGPSPHDLLSMSLASCTAMTVKLYADKKQWPLENMNVVVDVEKGSEGTIFNRQVSFFGKLDETQKARLLEIANHCPIHKVLSGKIEIKTILV